MPLIKLTYDFIEETNTLRIFPIEDEHPFFKYMENVFTIQVFSTDDFKAMYKKSNFYNSMYAGADWDGDYVIDSDQEKAINNAITILKSNISKIRVGEEFLEFAAKMKFFSSYYELSNEDGYTVYTDCITSFGQDKKIDFSFEIVDVIYNSYKSDKEFDISVNCTVFYNINNREIRKNFVIKATTFDSVYFNLKQQEQQLIPRYILANTLDINQIKDLIYKTVNNINVSSEQELLLKLSIFANDFYSIEYFLPMQISKGKTYNFILED